MDMSSNKKLFIFFQSVLVLMLVQLGTDLYLPSVPAICLDLGINEFYLKLSLTIMIASLGLSQLFYGPISDSIGRKPVMLHGLLIFIAGSSLLVFFHSVPTLFIGRAIQGLGLGFGLSIASAIASDIYEGRNVNKAISIISAIYAIMPVVAPLIGGTLQTYVGWRSNFYFLLTAGIMIFFLILFFYPETNINIELKKFKINYLVGIYFIFLRDKIFICYLLVATLFYAGEVSYVIQMPLVAQGLFGATSIEAGWLVMFTSSAIVIGSISSAFLINKISPNRIILIGVVCAILCLISLLYFEFFLKYTLVTFIFPMVLFMLGSGFAFPNCISKCLEMYPEHAGAASALVLGLLTLLGGCLTIIVAKLPSKNNWSLTFLVFIIVILMLLTSVYLYRFRKKTYINS